MTDEQTEKQVQAMQTLVELSQKRTRMSAQRSYMNAERTLSVWVRTSLAAMIFGIAIDRLGLLFRGHSHFLIHQDTPSAVTGAVLVAFSMFMALSAALRFIAYSRSYKKEYSFPAHHNASLPTIYSFMIVLFGAVLLFLILWIN
ncbi:MAG TPA: DUF202 domain-containing protein [Chitinophagaceae bacterium]|nr:DUF202 domain-containing protein [Chitinophagaceae bacterium]